MQFLSLRAWDYILHACRKEKNLAHALRLCSYIGVCGLLTDDHLGNLLVSTLVEAGCTHYAQQVFDGLAQTHECSWNALIIGYAKDGEIEHAFVLYREMQLVGLHPSGHAFVALLKLCSRLKDVDKGHQLHSDIADMGLEENIFVGNTIIDMYSNFGCFDKAEDAFNKLRLRDAVSWSTLIAAQVKHGYGREALGLFEEMQLQGVIPTIPAFVCAMKACKCAGDHRKGLTIHADIVRFGLIDTDPGIGNSLVDMYATLGLLATAQEVFDTLAVRDQFSWTALITGYSQHGFPAKALEIFDLMQEQEILQDVVTFICGLTACSSLGDAEKSQEIHVEVARRGFLEKDAVVGNALVDAYASCGLLVKAKEVFDVLLVRDVVAWTALISGLTKQENDEEALEKFEQMQQEGILPNSYAYVCGLQACGNIGAADKGQEIHAEIARKELLDSDIIVTNALVDMYANCGLLLRAQELFDRFLARDTVCWNILISGYSKHDCDEEVLDVFKQMQHENASPNAVTFVYVLIACRVLVKEGLELHAEIARGSLHLDLNVGNALLDMYASSGLLGKALEVLEELPQRDVVSWTALIAGYARYGWYDDALNSFEQMQNEGISPNAVTFAYVLKVCGTFVLAERGQEIHSEILEKSLSEYDVVVRNTLIDMYAKCGLLEEAQKVFDELPTKEDVAWNALIAGYSQIGECHKISSMLVGMIKEAQDPDILTFVGVLNACSHAGSVDKGFLYVEAMQEDYGHIANLEHLTCIVDLLSRAGQLNKAIAMTQWMPCHPNLVTFHTVLSSCRRDRNLELGLQMFTHAIELDRGNAGTYLTLMNMYADPDLETCTYSTQGKDAEQVGVIL